MAYILNEDGFRDRMHGRQPSTVVDATAAAPVDPVPEGGAPAQGGAPAAEGRPSVARTSLGRTSLGRTSAGGGRPNIGRNSVQVIFLKGSATSDLSSRQQLVPGRGVKKPFHQCFQGYKHVPCAMLLG